MDPSVEKLAFEAIESGVYQKDIHYIFGKRDPVEELLMAKTLAASPGMSAWAIQSAYTQRGTQIQVSKHVSRMLIASDFSERASVHDVPWLDKVVEVYFEDKKLPTILCMKTSPQELREWFPQVEIGLKAEEYITCLMQEGKDIETAKMLSLQLKPDMYDSFLAEGKTEKMNTGILSSELSARDSAIMCYMLHLVLKVFTFASIPIYKPIPLAHKQMYFGGGPGIENRPNRPSRRVIYMPKVVHETSGFDGDGKEHDFKGRRGHIRWYISEVFVNKKGTWAYIPPVINPHTGKYPIGGIIRVRKP